MPARSPARQAADLAAVTGLLDQRPARRPTLQVSVAHRTENVPVEKIHPRPNQPRQHFDEAEMAELVESIRSRGVIQAINLRQVDDDAYWIVAGERRWRAVLSLYHEPPTETHNPADFATIPATISEMRGPDAEALTQVDSLIENLVRVDLNDAEKASALLTLRESTGWTWEQIGKTMGLSVARVQNMAAIGRHDDVRQAVEARTVTQKQAMLLGRVAEPELRGALLTVLPEYDERASHQLVRTARTLDTQLPATERVRTAAALVDAGPGRATRSHTIPLRQNGQPVGTLQLDEVLLLHTPLRALRPRVTQMSVAAYEEMLREAVAERGWDVVESRAAEPAPEPGGPPPAGPTADG